MRKTVHASLACWPALKHLDAAAAASAGATDPYLGSLASDHLQLVPQGQGLIDEALLDAIRCRYPRSAVRLHANVHILSRRVVTDLSNFTDHPQWFARAAELHRYAGSSVYSAHAGRRCNATVQRVVDNARRCADLFGSPVAVEGLYPLADRAPGGRHEFLVSTWEEYRELLDARVWMAIDLSHLNILAHQSGRFERQLTQELLASEWTVEVHLSHNDGSGDWHQVCDSAPWWSDLIPYINQTAVVFSEGNQRRSMKERKEYAR